MKDFFKKNIWGIGMSAAMGGLTFLLYLVGRGEGYIECGNDITNALKDVLEEASKETTE